VIWTRFVIRSKSSVQGCDDKAAGDAVDNPVAKEDDNDDTDPLLVELSGSVNFCEIHAYFDTNTQTQ
jgi:hypothetical protein